MNYGERALVNLFRGVRNHAFVVLVASSAVLFSQAGSTEKLGGASYQDVCKKFEDEGVTTRTQRGQSNSGMDDELLGNTLILVDAGNSGGGRRGSNVSNSEIIVSGDMNKIATVTSNTQGPQPKSASSTSTVRSSACDK
jgi:hypothetical protein